MEVPAVLYDGLMLHLFPAALISALVVCAVVVAFKWPRGVRVAAGKFLAIFAAEAKRHRAVPFAIQRSSPAGNSSNSEQMLWTAVALDALNVPLAAWEQWHSIDPHVFQAFSQMTHESIHNLADLTRTVDLHHYPIANHSFIEAIKGHVGEWQVNADLSNLHPVMAHASNFPATDLWLHGHAANVKTVADAGPTLAEHFGRYPDVAAIIPVDAHHIPSDALYYHPGDSLSPSVLNDAHTTIVDAHLSNADMLAHTQHALDAVGHPVGGFGIPWFTLAITGFVEGKLLLKGDTSFERAAMTTFGTVASVGTGMYAGHSIGAAVGTFLLPGVGTIAGAVIGGVLGAFGGRAVVNAARHKRLHSVSVEFERAHASYKRKANEISIWVHNEWQTGLATISEHLYAKLNDIGAKAEQSLDVTRADLDASNSMSKLDAIARISASQRLVAKRLLRIQQWSRVPGIGLLLIRGHASLAQWNAAAADLLNDWVGSPQDIAALFDLALISRAAKASARSYVRTYFADKRSRYDAANAASETAVMHAIQERATAVDQSRSLWQRIDHEATSKMQLYRVLLREKAHRLQQELCSLGARESESVEVLDQLLALPPPNSA
ncbi:MAG: hypothetical protein ACYCPH_03530 [Minisyncoccota bacterium]